MKKLLYVLVMVLSFFVIDDIHAEEVCAPSHPYVVLMGSTAEVRVPVYISDDVVRKDARFFLQKINGFYAFCLDMGGGSNSDMSFTPTKLEDVGDELSWWNRAAIGRAFNFVLENPGDEMAYIVAQVGVWISIANSESGGAGITTKPAHRKSITSVWCALKEGRTDCLEGEEGYEYVEDNYYYRLNYLFNRYYEGSVPDEDVVNSMTINGKKIALYHSNNPDAQRLVGLYDCPEVGPYACPDGSKSQEIEDCVSEKRGNGYSEDDALKTCQDEKCIDVCQYGNVVQHGSSAVCSNSTVNSGTYYEIVDFESHPCGNASIHGESEKQISEYCNLYCLETSAQQIFPGSVTPAVSTGTYIIWPTSEATVSSVYGNRYPLKFTGKKECYVELAANSVNSNDVEDTYDGLVEKAEEFLEEKPDSCNEVDHDYESIRLSSKSCEEHYQEHFDYLTSEATRLYQIYEEKKETYENKKTDYENCENTRECKNDSPCCSEEDLNCVETNNCAPCHWNHWCDSEAAAMNIAEAAMNSAKGEYDKMNDHKNSCEGNIDACKGYVDNVKAITTMTANLNTCATARVNCSGSSCELYNYETNIDLSWNDNDYGATITDSQLEKTTNYSSYVENDVGLNAEIGETLYNNNSFDEIKDKAKKIIDDVRNIVANRKIVMNAEVTYSLPTSNLLYNYVVKYNNGSIVSMNYVPGSNVTYSTIGYSNLPVSINALTNKTYELKLSNIRFGDNGQYGTQISVNDYVCNYNVTKTPSSSCVCPVDTYYEGKDLFDIMANEGLTCIEAQEKYCVTNPSTPPGGPLPSEGPHTCPDGTDLTNCMQTKDYFACYDEYCTGSNENEYCPYPYNYINLTPCLNNGYDYNYCYNKFCNDGGDGDSSDDDSGGYKCKNSNGVDGPMDITTCVITKMTQGLTEQQAIDECDSLVCPIGGLRIIYRTISLENPFPGKNIIGRVTTFNEIGKGRYPGTNWNDVQLVRNHIRTVTRQGQTYNGSSIYQEAEPLYTFELTTDIINEIRDYNEQRVSNGAYADYGLDCKGNATACVSSFVHDSSLSGLVGGVCANAVSRNNFYTCSGD